MGFQTRRDRSDQSDRPLTARHSRCSADCVSKRSGIPLQQGLVFLATTAARSGSPSLTQISGTAHRPAASSPQRSADPAASHQIQPAQPPLLTNTANLIAARRTDNPALGAIAHGKNQPQAQLQPLLRDDDVAGSEPCLLLQPRLPIGVTTATGHGWVSVVLAGAWAQSATPRVRCMASVPAAHMATVGADSCAQGLSGVRP